MTPVAQRLEDRWLLSATGAFDHLDGDEEGGDGQPDTPGGATGGGDVTSEFDITLRFHGELTPEQRAAFESAEARWERVVIGDLPAYFIRDFGMVDDLLIDVTVMPIDGPQGILGRAGTDVVRPGSWLPVTAHLEFDTDDLALLQENGQLEHAAFHEMGHALGLGQRLWDVMDLILDKGTDDPRFIGPLATAEFNALFGLSEPSVPLAGHQSGSGSADSHWRESVFGNELMTSSIGPGNGLPLSRITIAALADMGYTVDYSEADAYVPPPLEDLAGVEFSAEDGRLTVNVVVSSSIEIVESEGIVQVLANGVALEHEAWPVSDVKSILVVGSGGHDRIDLRAVTPLSFPNVGEVSVVGGGGMDTIYGSEFGDAIDAGYGQDAVYAGGGNDTIHGGHGQDELVGDGGDDLIIGGGGKDRLNGRSGRDTLQGGHGNDRLFGGRGRDVLDGEQDNDVLKGQGGRDTLHVQNGDVLKGNTSRDTLHMDDTQPTLTLDETGVPSSSLTAQFFSLLFDDHHETHSHDHNPDEPFEFAGEWVDLV